VFDQVVRAFTYGAMAGAALGGFGVALVLCAMAIVEVVSWWSSWR
jgi:hypothetical protein